MKINLIEYFEKTVCEHSAKTAVIDGERSISFFALRRKSILLSNRIITETSGVIRKPIGVFLPKSIESIVSDIGILYSGNAYMNLDVKTPMARIRSILDCVKPILIVTDSNHYGALSAIFQGKQIIQIDSTKNDTSPVSQDALSECLEKIIDTDPLCIINTSGSTGTPKGVVLNHRSFIDYTQWAITTIGLRNDDVFGSIAPIVFDHSSFELCLLMSLGCTMVILPEMYCSFPVKLLQMVSDKKVSFIFWVPTLMVNIANMDLLSKIALPTLRMVWFAGEVFPTKQFNYWRRKLPNATFVNLYGPTEITVDCTYYVVKRELADNEPIPIGYPCRNTDILILNSKNQLCNIEEEGELCVRGTSLAMGYYNNPEKTSAVFVQNPLNQAYPELIYRTGDIVYLNKLGEIVYKGRNDSLIKHMGKRIELGEIEHTIINTLKMVLNGCAVYDYMKKEIVFFYENDSEVSFAEFRRKIVTVLPNYMVPTKFIRLDAMPRNTNGKIDRLLLKKSLDA